MLWFVYVFNFLDRQLLAILAKPIQDSLHISDRQLGLIGGLYFALFYCFIAIPVGWLADKTNRVKVLSLSCAIWSAATMGCGFSASYPQLVTARMMVGFGEAGGVPPSYSILSDYFPTGRRGTAFGIYNLGPPIGAALGIAFGATIAAAFNWRRAFLLVGATGVVVALAVLFIVQEPRRGGVDRAGQAAARQAEFWQTFAMFFARPTIVLAALGSGATQFITYGLGNFATLDSTLPWHVCSARGGGAPAQVARRPTMELERGHCFAAALVRSAKVIVAFCRDFSTRVVSSQLLLVYLSRCCQGHRGNAHDLLGKPPARHLAAQKTEERFGIEHLPVAKLHDQDRTLPPLFVRTCNDRSERNSG